MSYLIVDEMHAEHPELIKDQYWDEVDFEPPYTAASAFSKQNEPFLGSAMSIRYIMIICEKCGGGGKINVTMLLSWI